MQQRQVRDLMRIRHSHVVTESATLREVAERLIISDCDVMAVTDAVGKLSGIVCESSVVRALMSSPADNATIQSIVCRHAESIRLEASLNTVVPMFRSSANSAIPVVDENGRVQGLLMRRDVISNLLHVREDAAQLSAEAQESSSTKNRVPFIKPNTTLIAHAAEAEHGPASAAQKPHFLRADEARRVLWEAEDRL